MARERLLVIGGDAGGMSAASQARRMRSPDELEIVAFERGEHTSYSACGIPYVVGGTVTGGEDRLIERSPAQFAERAIDARILHEVLAIDLGARRLTVRRLADGVEIDEPFDHLMIATGAVPIRPRLDGIEATGVFGIQTLDDGAALRSFIEAVGARRAAVVGGGYIGLEMAEAMVERGLEVTLFEAAPQPMPSLDHDMGALVAESLRAKGVTVRVEEPVRALEARDGRVTGVVTDAGAFRVDVVVLGMGVRPNVALARDAGIEVGASGGIATDDRMRTTVDRVWAAGDCVQCHHRVLRRPAVVALGTHANKQGRVAGTNIAGGDATFPGVVGTAAMTVCDLEVARTGLTEAQAREEGIRSFAVTKASRTKAGYFPGAARVHVKVVAERPSGRFLGAQIVGGPGSAKRIDVFAAALWNGMTVGEIAMMDLAYAPPLSPVWDPVLIAARSAAEALERS